MAEEEEEVSLFPDNTYTNRTFSNLQSVAHQFYFAKLSYSVVPPVLMSWFCSSSTTSDTAARAGKNRGENEEKTPSTKDGGLAPPSLGPDPSMNLCEEEENKLAGTVHQHAD